MNNKEKIKNLHEHVQNLDKLLSDNEQGSIAWGILVHQEWEAIVDLWCGSASATECPKVKAEKNLEIYKKQKSEMSPIEFEREYLGEFK